jgi:hypothetical protein
VQSLIPVKRCPTCQRPYTDLSLNFCLEDGTALISDASSSDPEAETLRLGSGYDTTPIGAAQPDLVGLEVVVQLEGKGKQVFRNNQFAGTRQEGRGLEGFQLRLDPPIQGLSLKYTAHLEVIGDKSAREGEWLGAGKGESCRLEGFRVELTGPLAERYDVSYMAHVRGLGDTAIFKNGDFCGTRRRGLRVEGIQVNVSHAGHGAQPIKTLSRLDGEAETLKIPPKKPEMSPADIIMEIADHLRKTISRGEQALVRFEPLTGLGLTIAQISEHFTAAAQKADCKIIEKTETRATVRRDPGAFIA